MARRLWMAACLALWAACGTSDAGDDSTVPYQAGMTIASAQGLFDVSLTSDPGPPAFGMNKLTLDIKQRSDAAAVTGAFVKVVPYMPSHGHGSGTQPIVTEVSPGVFSAEQVDLSMRGLWELRIQVNTIDLTDTATFRFEVE